MNTEMNTEQEALDYIHAVASLGSRPGLSRMTELMNMLGNPQNNLRCIHVAGTNGKGSTCAMLASVLQAAGYRTGLYTSPYIMRFHERIRINGDEISGEELLEYTNRVRACADKMSDHPTEFELVTAIAFCYYADKKCDFVVLEVGMGGRLDATNIIPSPECAVICNIGLDHTAILGDTVAKIAAEKAGIIKAGTTCVIYEPEDDSVLDTIARRCREVHADMRPADFDEIVLLDNSLEEQTFCYYDDKPRTISLCGFHQICNAAVVLECIDVLREHGIRISEKAVDNGLRNARWPARFELLRREPCFILDGGHNPQCAESVADNLDNYFPDCKRVLLLGILKDKDVDSVLEILAPMATAFVCVTPDSPRALPASELAAKLREYTECPICICSNITDGVQTAINAAGRNGMVCAVGSLYMSGEIRKAVTGEDRIALN